MAEQQQQQQQQQQSTPILPAGVQALSRRCPDYPPALKQSPAAPRTLYVAGGRERLARLLAEPVVAIVGSERASDYGMEMARSLARGLAAAGVTVLSAFANGIAAAAHAGALRSTTARPSQRWPAASTWPSRRAGAGCMSA